MLKRTKKDENNTSFSVGDTVEEKLASSTLRPAFSQDRYKGEEKTIIGEHIFIEGSIRGTASRSRRSRSGCIRAAAATTSS